MTIIDGKVVSAHIRQELSSEVKELGIKPKLAVILVGNDPASAVWKTAILAKLY